MHLWVAVAEEPVARVAEPRGELGAEGGEHAEPRLQRLAAREVVGVPRFPAERLAGRPFHARQVHAARLELVQRTPGVVAPDHAHDLYGVMERSEEHTSELQSRLHLVCRLLLEKKKKNNSNHSGKQSSA